MNRSWSSLLPILLLATCSYSGPNGESYTSTASCELSIRQPVYWYCGRQSWRDTAGAEHTVPTCFVGKRQRVVVWTGGSYEPMDGINAGQGKIEVNGQVVSFDEQGFVR